MSLGNKGFTQLPDTLYQKNNALLLLASKIHCSGGPHYNCWLLGVRQIGSCFSLSLMKLDTGSHWTKDIIQCICVFKINDDLSMASRENNSWNLYIYLMQRLTIKEANKLLYYRESDGTYWGGTRVICSISFELNVKDSDFFKKW